MGGWVVYLEAGLPFTRFGEQVHVDVEADEVWWVVELF